MHPFTYLRANSAEDAVRLAKPLNRAQEPANRAPAQFVAGSTTMSDYMRLNVMQPEMLVDLNPLPRAKYGRIEAGDEGLTIGCLVRMGEAEDDAVIRKDYPVIRDTLHLAASRQIRNMASLGGNVLQRTRCEYFRETSWPCNKREPGSGCAAMQGLNRQHAVLGVSDQCIAAYAGDFAQALIALDASVETLGADGKKRRIKFADLHTKPGDTPEVETVLQPGELITFYHVPAGAWTKRSLYLKIRDRDSYQFALTAAAVALDLDGDEVREARIALGGVATVPWRAHAAEAELNGKTLDETTARKAADAAFEGAVSHEHNAFKMPLGKETVVRALLQAKQMKV